jgi:hypothetical protein
MKGERAGAFGISPATAATAVTAATAATAASADMRLSKPGLHDLADRLLADEPDAVERCVAFLIAESRGFWHNRARAMMSRRLKHCTLSAAQRDALVAGITPRLETGAFPEQFKDQLRLALHIDPAATRRAAAAGLDSPAGHVRRYAAWVLSAEHLRDRPPMV